MVLVSTEARTYSPLIRLAGRAHPVLAHALQHEWVQQMFRLGDSDSGSVGHAGFCRRSVWTCCRLGEMRAAAVEPNGHSYLAVFDVYKAARDVEGARRAWQDMRAAGVQPVYPAVSTIMSAVAKTGDISATEAGAKKLWYALLKLNRVPKSPGFKHLHPTSSVYIGCMTGCMQGSSCVCTR